MFYHKMSGETDCLSFGLNKYPQSAEQFAVAIVQMPNTPGACMLLAMQKSEIVASGTLGIVVHL